MMLRNSLVLLFLLIVPCYLLADVVLSDEEYDETIAQMENAKKALEGSQKRWDGLRKAVPEIQYRVEGNLIIQNIIVPVEKDTPIEFQNRFKLTRVDKKPTFFPFVLRLVGGIELVNKADAKFGIKFFGLDPLKHENLRPIGLNLLIGIKSSGLSMSYDLPHPFSNTAIHVYYGTCYNEEFSKTLGLGVSLNF